MGWQNDIFQVLIVEAGQPGSGLFVYTGQPASGNLIASIAATAGTDQFGNAYQAGICVYGGAGQPFLQLFVAGLLPTAVPNLNLKSSRAIENTPLKLALDVVNTGLVNEWLEANLFGPSISQQKDYVAVHFQSSAKDLSNVAVGSLTYFDSAGTAHFQGVWDSAGFHVSPKLWGTAGILTVGDNLAMDTGKTVSADIWHSLGALTGYTVSRGRYRLMPEGEVEFDVHVTGGGANASGVNFANTLPAVPVNYQPALTRRYPLESGRAVTAGDPWPRVEITAAGVVTVVTAANVTSSFSGGFAMPLD